MGILLEFLRRLGNATADAAVGFLFSEDIPITEAEDEVPRSQSKSSSNSGKIAPSKAPQTVQNSPLDSFGEGLAESVEGLGAGHKHETAISWAPEAPSRDECMHHSR